MSLHTEELFLKEVKRTVNNSKNIFHLAEINKYVKGKTMEYAEANDVVKTGEYFILNQYIDKKMQKLLSKRIAFKPQ